MEGALAAWQQRYEQERIDQGFFTSEAEAFKHGCAPIDVFTKPYTHSHALTHPPTHTTAASSSA